MKAVNLLPSDQRGAAKAAAPAAPSKAAPTGDGFGAYAILGALALVVVAVAAMVLTKNTINDRKAELARTDQQVQAVAREAAALKPYADFKSLADARVQTVQSLATSRFDWEQTLRDLSRALPSDVRLASFSGKVGGANPDPGAGAAVASPTIELAGCTSSQTSTAKLMARLRAIRGVSRVSLKSSAKSGEGAAAVASSGTADGGRLCKKQNSPTFALTLAFERFNVPVVSAPAGAGVGGATGPTGPTGGTTPAPGTTPTTPAAANSATQGVSTP
jgi:Tfp pilus assembly protein PilN